MTNTNRSPVLAPIGNKSIEEGSLLSFTVSATDADGDTITYSAVNLPAGAAIGATTGVFKWTPSFTQAGSYPGVVFHANDGHGGDTTETITITVTVPPPDFSLSASPREVSIVQGGSGTSMITVNKLFGFDSAVSLSASDSDVPSLAGRAPGTDGVTISFDPLTTTETSTVTFTADESALPGDHVVTITGNATGFPSHMTSIILTVAPKGNDLPVSLPFNINSGIVADGTSFSSGFDNGGSSYSSNLLGHSAGFDGIVMSYGPPNGDDAVASTVVNLPFGRFVTLEILAAAVNGNQLSQTFTVRYSDNTTQTFTQSLSDWTRPANFAGETIVTAMAGRNRSDGTFEATPVNVYGYSFTLFGKKNVSSITLPRTRNVAVLAMSLIAEPPPIDLP